MIVYTSTHVLISFHSLFTSFILLFLVLGGKYVWCDGRKKSGTILVPFCILLKCSFELVNLHKLWLLQLLKCIANEWSLKILGLIHISTNRGESNSIKKIKKKN